jgi:hypothetical protein
VCHFIDLQALQAFVEKKEHASRHHPARRPHDGFVSNPFEPDTLFIKCVLHFTFQAS